jgi:hypothetical protein
LAISAVQHGYRPAEPGPPLGHVNMPAGQGVRRYHLHPLTCPRNFPQFRAVSFHVEAYPEFTR